MRLGPLAGELPPAALLLSANATVPTTTAAPPQAVPATATPAAVPLTATTALPELALSLGLSPGAPSAAVITALVRDGLPLTPEVAQRVLTLWRASDMPTPAAAALLWLGERRIPATAERARLVQAFRTANPGTDGPPPGTLLLTARLAPNQPPLVTAWPWLGGLPADAQRPLATPEPPPDGPPADAADDAVALKPSATTRVALLLSVETAHLGAVEALVATVEQRVEVTFFSDQPAAVQSLASELPTLGAALTAAGLLPAGLAACLAAPAATAAGPAPGLTRLDVRV